MSAITSKPKPFDNLSGFERGLWQPQVDRFSAVQKRRVLGKRWQVQGLLYGLFVLSQLLHAPHFIRHPRNRLAI